MTQDNPICSEEVIAATERQFGLCADPILTGLYVRVNGECRLYENPLPRIPVLDDQGDQVLDEEGNPVYEMDDEGNLLIDEDEVCWVCLGR